MTQQAVNVPVLLDADATAAALSVCTKTIRGFVRTGLLPVVRIGPRGVRFDPRDFVALIDGLKKSSDNSCNMTTERVGSRE